MYFSMCFYELINEISTINMVVRTRSFRENNSSVLLDVYLLYNIIEVSKSDFLTLGVVVSLCGVLRINYHKL